MGLSSLKISFCSTALAFLAVDSLEQQQQQMLRRPNHRRIETQEIEPGLFSIAVSPPANYMNSGHRKLEEMNSCVLYAEDVYYVHEDPTNLELRWVCTFENYVTEDGDGPSPYSFYIDGDNMEKNNQFLEENSIVSGTHTLHWDSSSLVDLDEETNTITVNADITDDQRDLWIQPIESTQRELLFLAQTDGIKQTLVIRIVGGGIAPEDNLVQIRREIFEEDISLKKQMAACSHSQLTIEPYEGTTQGIFTDTINGGVVELRIGTNPTGLSDKKMENEAIRAAWYVFGDLRQQFDLVMFVMPPGIKPEFAAYAYIGTQFSYYSNTVIRDTMVQMHEVGHNLGLQHSGQGHEEYGDSSGYMGYSDATDPLMCYNAVNNYQLGWYSAHSFSPIADDERGGTFLITGVHRYDPNDVGKFVTLRLVQRAMPNDYYIGYNKAEGINADTQEDRDKIIIYMKDGDTHESKLSWKIATLSVGEMYVIQDYDSSGRYVTVTFVDVVEEAAVVEVLPESSESPTTTPLPSNSPSATPSAKPSDEPTPVPTTRPSFSPSESPSSTPSVSLNPTISARPSSSPSDKPSSSPTTSPAPSVSIAPSLAPSTSPTMAPTISSAPSVSSAPSAIPSESPTHVPSGSPSASPTDMPSANPSSALTCANDLSMKVVIKTDMSPGETSWKLRRTGGESLSQISAHQYTKEREKHVYNYCLEYDACYRFSIFDEGGDGMGDDPIGGFYAIYLGDESKVRHRGDWGSKRSHKICTHHDPSMFIGDNLKNGGQTNTETQGSGIFVQLPDNSESELADELSELGVAHTYEAEVDNDV